MKATHLPAFGGISQDDRPMIVSAEPVERPTVDGISDQERPTFGG